MVLLSQTLADALLDAHRAVSRALETVPREVGMVSDLSDAELTELLRIAAGQRRRVDATIAAAAGEIARRSDPALGKNGLARGAGFRTAELLVQELTGSTAVAAKRDVEIGRVLRESDETSWLGSVRDAVLDGAINTEQAAAITKQLGTPTDKVPAEVLKAAATGLVDAADTMNADRIRDLSREIRNDLELDRVQDREALLHSKRSARMYGQDDGMSKLVWLMDPETAAIIKSIIDRATSPRLGGPRFVDAARKDTADRIETDPRTTEQIASDVLRDLLSAGAALDADAAEHLLLQIEQPAVKIIVTAQVVASRTGAGYLEGSGAEVSITTIDRARCTGTTQTLTYGPSGKPLDVGRRERLFTGRQREILAAKWGGCAIPWCDRPPTWCEYHHIHSWHESGRTDTDNGIPLCRTHHQDLHNNGWRIKQTAGELCLHTPDRPDPVPLRPKGRAFRGRA